MNKKRLAIIGVLGVAVVTVMCCFGLLILSVFVSSLPQNESTTNQTPVPKLIAPPTLALRLTETAVPTKSVATSIPIPQSPTLPIVPLGTQTTQPAKTTTPTVRATLRPTVASQPTAKTGCPQGCTEQKPGCDIKGNISVSSGEKIYHVPGGRYYDSTVIDPRYGERWFCTEQEAIANGWRKSSQ